MSHEEVVDSFLHAIERNDMEAVSAIYADDVRVWHNVDDVAQTKNESIAMLSSLAVLEEQRYVVEDRVVSGDRLAQRHRLIVRTRSGATLDLLVAIFFTLKGGKIADIHEYFDTPALAPLMNELNESFGERAHTGPSKG